jgi:hypothetical protein
MKTTDKGAQYDHVNEGVITSIEGESVDYEYDWDFGGKGRAGFGIAKVAKKAKVGDRIKVYIHGGSMIGQVDINGKPVHWKTPAQEALEHAAWRAKAERRKQIEFKKEKAKLDADYATLPRVLQLRLDVFREYCPTDFRVDYESYEMVVLKDAVKLAGIPKDDPDWWYKWFRDAKYEEQRAALAVEGVKLDEGLSGNQFGMIVSMAWRLETNPDQAFQWHGAMTPLTGCIEYGCPHPRKLTEEGYWVDDIEWTRQITAEAPHGPDRSPIHRLS